MHVMRESVSADRAPSVRKETAIGFAKRMKRGTVYHATRLLLLIFNAIPRSMAVFFGGMIGLVAWKMLPRDRYRISRHLTLAFNSRFSAARRNNIGRDFFIKSGKNLADMVRFRSRYATELKPLIDVEGLEHFDTAYRRGKGVLGVTGHIGNFELLAVHLASLGYEIAVIGRELYDLRLNRLLVANREALGLTNIATTDSPRAFLNWLKRGRAIGVLIDTDSIRVRGMFIPAFGRLSNTPVGQSIIGLKAGAAFVPIACVRTGDNRYKVIIKPEARPEPDADFDKAVYQVTLACTRALEEIIASYPDQWIWLHNRWHTRPENIA